MKTDLLQKYIEGIMEEDSYVLFGKTIKKEKREQLSKEFVFSTYCDFIFEHMDEEIFDFLLETHEENPEYFEEENGAEEPTLPVKKIKQDHRTLGFWGMLKGEN